MEKYDFRFQVWTGTILIIYVCLVAIGISAPTVENDIGPGSPLWTSFLAAAFALPGVFFCGYAYWRARKRAANLGLFFLCLAAYFGVATIGLHHNPEPDNPSTTSLILAVLTCAVAGGALFVFDYILVRRFGPKPTDSQVISTVNLGDSLAGPSPAWKFVTRMGRLLLFVFCLFLSRIIVSPRFIQEDWPRVALFVVVLLLSCVVSGLISEETVPKFLSFLNFKQK
jgi:hypothetical protein